MQGMQPRQRKLFFTIVIIFLVASAILLTNYAKAHSPFTTTANNSNAKQLGFVGKGTVRVRVTQVFAPN